MPRPKKDLNLNVNRVQYLVEQLKVQARDAESLQRVTADEPARHLRDHCRNRSLSLGTLRRQLAAKG